MEVSVSWFGPYVFVPQAGFECVFDREEARSPGLYLWTIEFQNGYLVNYVGETGRTLCSRLIEGVAWSYGGREGGISDPEQFKQGRAIPFAKFTFSQFLADYARLSSAIHNLFRCYRVFIAPTGVAADIRKYIEGGIIRAIWEAGGEIADFLCNKRLLDRSPEPLLAKFVTRARFHGLSEIIHC